MAHREEAQMTQPSFAEFLERSLLDVISAAPKTFVPTGVTE